MEHTCSIKIGGTKWNKSFIPTIPFHSFLTSHHSHRPPPPSPPPATATATGYHRHRPPPATVTTSGHRHHHRPPPPPPVTVTTFGHRHRLRPQQPPLAATTAIGVNVGVNWSFNQPCSVPSSLVMSYQTLNNCPVLFCHVLSCPIQSYPENKRTLIELNSTQIYIVL